MPRPTTRVLALLELLQAGGTRTVAELADRLGVDERTVRRYVEHLTELDIPVETLRGRYGGYRLARGYRLPPLMFSDDEAVAVALGLVTARRLGLAPVPVESAAAKLRRVLPRPLATRLAALADAVALAEPPAPASGVGTELLLTLATAAQSRHLVAIKYVDRQQRSSERTIAPYGLVTHFGRWYVTGTDSTSGELRSFRLDRIAAATVSATAFEPPVEFDPVDAVLTGIAAAPWRFQVIVQVQGELEAIRSALPQRLARLAPAEPGWVRVEFRAERLDWVPSVLIGLGHPFRVDGPPELIERLRVVAERLTAAVG